MPLEILWDLAVAIIPLLVIAVLFMAFPAIVGTLIGKIIVLFKYIFGKIINL